MTPHKILKKDYLTLAEVAAECDVQLDDLRYFGEEGKLAICLRQFPLGWLIGSKSKTRPRRRIENYTKNYAKN